MTRRADRPSWLAVAALVAGAALISFVLYQTEQPFSRWVGIAFLVGMASVVLFTWLQQRGADRRLRQLLVGRESLSLTEFASLFQTIPNGPETAIGVRRLLEEYIDRDLSGLRPNDPLTEFRDWLDSDFIDELAVRLDFQPPENYAEYSALVAPLLTVRDLVEAVARKLPPP